MNYRNRAIVFRDNNSDSLHNNYCCVIATPATTMKKDTDHFCSNSSILANAIGRMVYSKSNSKFNSNDYCVGYIKPAGHRTESMVRQSLFAVIKQTSTTKKITNTTDNNNNNNNNVLSRRQPVLSAKPCSASQAVKLLLVISFLLNINHYLLVVYGFEGEEQMQTTEQLSDKRNPSIFVDPNCRWIKEEPPSEAEKLLFIMKCDLNPLIKSFEQLMFALEPKGPKQLLSIDDVYNMVGVDNSDTSKGVRIEIISFTQAIEQFFEDSMSAINRKEFCTYPTIKRFKQLKTYILNGSNLLDGLYNLIAIEYHTYCLEQALRKLPKIPDIVKQIVDIYIDGANSSLPDLNRPPGFRDEKKDEFKFDLEKAIEQNGPLEVVVDLVMDFGFGLASSKVKIKQFKNECKKFLIDIEERWQSMEMMSKMLSTQLNAIEEFNNFLMRALIPTKYADVCSQLSLIS